MSEKTHLIDHIRDISTIDFFTEFAIGLDVDFKYGIQPNATTALYEKRLIYIYIYMSIRLSQTAGLF